MSLDREANDEFSVVSKFEKEQEVILLNGRQSVYQKARDVLVGTELRSLMMLVCLNWAGPQLLRTLYGLFGSVLDTSEIPPSRPLEILLVALAFGEDCDLWKTYFSKIANGQLAIGFPLVHGLIAGLIMT